MIFPGCHSFRGIKEVSYTWTCVRIACASIRSVGVRPQFKQWFWDFPGNTVVRLPRWLSGKEYVCQCRRRRFNPLGGKILWKRKWQHTLVFFPGQSHGQRSLVDYSPWGCKELVTPKQLVHGVTKSRTRLSDWTELNWAAECAQWIRVCLPMQGRWVWCLVQENFTCWEAAQPQLLSLSAATTEAHVPKSQQAAITEAHMPRACVPQQEKPSQWEAHAPQQRIALFSATRESLWAAMKDPA